MESIPFKVVPTSLAVCSYDSRLEGGYTVARLLVPSIEVLVPGLIQRELLGSEAR